jgi:hypothetical protein
MSAISNVVSRFRRWKEVLQSSSSSAQPADVNEKDIQIPSEKEIGAPELTTHSPNHDPESAIDKNATEEIAFIEGDLKEYPAEVRNTVSFEDDQTLPTITFRYFILTFVFTAPGAFLYQMVLNHSFRSVKKKH